MMIGEEEGNMQKEIEKKHRSISYDHLLFLSEMRLVYVKLNDRVEEAGKWRNGNNAVI